MKRSSFSVSQKKNLLEEQLPTIYDYCDKEIYNHVEEAYMRKKRKQVISKLE
jgi:hypothetical protein